MVTASSDQGSGDSDQLRRPLRGQRTAGCDHVLELVIGSATSYSRLALAAADVRFSLRTVHCSLSTGFPRTIEERGLFPVKRNTIVIGVTLFILATFAWAGWANWEYRKQAAERALAGASHAELIPATAGDVPQGQTSLIGKPAPDFVLEDLSGKTVALSSFKGKPLLINFWATWCGPCKIETPWLIELQNEYASKGFEIVGISTEGDDLEPGDKEGWARDKAAIVKFVKEEHMQYLVLINGDSLASVYGGLDAMPTSIYVNGEGKVVAVQLGITSKDDMEANIKKALGS